jgi:hypothetical protein
LLGVWYKIEMVVAGMKTKTLLLFAGRREGFPRWDPARISGSKNYERKISVGADLAPHSGLSAFRWVYEKR